MIKNTRTFTTWGAALTAAAAVTATIGATTGGSPPPSPQASTTQPDSAQPSAEGQVRTPPTQARPARSQRIASSVLGRDVKYTLTAVRSQADPLAASVRLQVFTFQGGTWKESDRATVGEVNGWFWFPLTGRHAVCEFSTASVEPAPLAVSLLVTPSIGCAPTENFQIRDGQITPA